MAARAFRRKDTPDLGGGKRGSCRKRRGNKKIEKFFHFFKTRAPANAKRLHPLSFQHPIEIPNLDTTSFGIVDGSPDRAAGEVSARSRSVTLSSPRPQTTLSGMEHLGRPAVLVNGFPNLQVLDGGDSDG